MAVAAPLSSASLEPTKITTRLHAPSITTVQDPRWPFAYSEAKTAPHELFTGHCEIRRVPARDDPRGRHVTEHRSGGLAMSAESVRAFLFGRVNATCK
jgi:hypothetical protein